MIPMRLMVLLLAVAVSARAESPSSDESKRVTVSGGISNQERSGKRPRPSLAQPTVNFPSQYALFMSEAVNSFHARDFTTTLSYVERADALRPPSPWTLNIRAAVAIELHEFEKGERYCKEALAMDPNFFEAKFNLSEIPFLQKKYAEARAGWVKLYDGLASDDKAGEAVVYRIFLTYLLEANLGEAKAWLEKLPFPSQTPAYQYAHAAWERQNGNLDKWDDWIHSAEFIWPISKRAVFADVLIQLGWLQKADPLAK